MGGACYIGDNIVSKIELAHDKMPEHLPNWYIVSSKSLMDIIDALTPPHHAAYRTQKENP